MTRKDTNNIKNKFPKQNFKDAYSIKQVIQTQINCTSMSFYKLNQFSLKFSLPFAAVHVVSIVSHCIFLPPKSNILKLRENRRRSF
jgi:hypothetical protein